MSSNPINRVLLDARFKALHVERPIAARQLANRYLAWRNRFDTVPQPAKVVTICGNGLTGKTSFLLNEARQELVGAENRADRTAAFHYVYCDLDVARKHEVREIEALLLIRNALNRHQVPTPVLDQGLRKYNVLTHGGLSRFGSGELEVPKELFDCVADAMVSTIFAGANPVAGAIGASIARVAIEGAKVVYRREKDLRRAEQEWREASDSLSSPDLREVYSKFPAYLAEDVDATPGRICLVIDSFEVVYGTDKVDDSPKWVEMLAGKPNLFLVVAGRRVPEQFDLAKSVELDLGSVDRKAFAEGLIVCGLNRGDAKKIARSCDQVPGLGVIIAKTGMGDWGMFDELSIEGDGDPKRQFEVLKRFMRDQLAQMHEHVARQLKAMAWIGSWRSGCIPSIPILDEFAEKELANLSYVGSSARGGYAVHALVASAIREICKSDFNGELERQVKGRLNDRSVGAEEVTALTQALVALAGNRVRECVHALCRKLILRNNPLDESISLSACGDILDLIGIMDYSAMDDGCRAAVDSYLEALLDYSEVELRYALLYEYVDPTFSFQRAQDAIDVCRRIVDFANSWFRRTLSPEDGNMRREAVLLDYAARLRKFAAVATEMYKLTSDYSYQVNSMQYELEAAESIVGHVIGKGRLATPDDLTLLCNMLNAMSISQYRLRRYDVSLPLREICCSLIESHFDDIEDEVKARALRSGATAYLAYVRDFDTEGTCHVSSGSTPRLEKLACSVSEALERAKELCQLSLKVRDTWSARITHADCTFEQISRGLGDRPWDTEGRYARAIQELELVRVDIVRKGQERHPEFARCMQRLAFAYESASEACQLKRAEYLRMALECGTAAEHRLLERHQSDEHVDVIKVRELIDRVKGRLSELDAS